MGSSKFKIFIETPTHLEVKWGKELKWQWYLRIFVVWSFFSFSIVWGTKRHASYASGTERHNSQLCAVPAHPTPKHTHPCTARRSGIFNLPLITTQAAVFMLFPAERGEIPVLLVAHIIISLPEKQNWDGVINHPQNLSCNKHQNRRANILATKVMKFITWLLLKSKKWGARTPLY